MVFEVCMTRARFDFGIGLNSIQGKREGNGEEALLERGFCLREEVDLERVV